MRYADFCSTFDETAGDPLIAWIDDPSTSDEDRMEYIGPEPWRRYPKSPSSGSNSLSTSS